MSERILVCPSCGNIVDRRFTTVNHGYCRCNTCGYSFDENETRADFGVWCVEKIKKIELTLLYLEDLVVMEQHRHIADDETSV